jgi:hypothetical protein
MRTSIYLVLGLLGFGASVEAQTYAIQSSVIGGGGGVSTNGQYSLAGTIGQPAADSMTGGNYVVQGGFWSPVGVVQTPGAPALSLVCSATNTMVLSWALTDTGWRLQSTASLSATPIEWRELPPPYVTNGGRIYLVEPPPRGSKFYRLYKPE